MESRRIVPTCGRGNATSSARGPRLVGALAAALLLTALSTAAPLAQAETPTAHPEPRQVDYLNGGVGQEQADLMRQMSDRFQVRFMFTQHNGTYRTDEFITGVRLRVTDAAGRTVLDLADQGPIFLLRLPDGTYTVEAEHEGDVKTRRFRIAGDRHQDIGFSWAG